MDKKLFEKIRRAAEASLKNPGKNAKPLPQHESKIDPEIYVFRHGETHDNANKIFSGWRDSELTKIGIEQAEILAKKLKVKKIDLCITSPQARALHTAKIALKYHKDILIEEDPRIMERNYGDLTGKSKSKLMEEDPEEAIKYRRAYDYPAPHGESIKMVEERVFPFCEELVERVRKNNINVAISCHGNSMRAIRRYFEKMSLEKALTIENPLAQSFAEYVIKNDKVVASSAKLPYSYIRKLRMPNKKLLKNYISRTEEHDD